MYHEGVLFDHGRSECRSAYTAAGSRLMQCQRNRLFATNRMEAQQYRNAVFFAIATLAYAGVAAYGKTIIGEGTKVVETIQIAQNLATNSFRKRLVLRLKNNPARGL